MSSSNARQAYSIDVACQCEIPQNQLKTRKAVVAMGLDCHHARMGKKPDKARGLRIRHRMEASGALSNAEYAKRLDGIGAGTVSRWINGHNMPGPESCRAIAHVSGHTAPSMTAHIKFGRELEPAHKANGAESQCPVVVEFFGHCKRVGEDPALAFTAALQSYVENQGQTP